MEPTNVCGIFRGLFVLKEFSRSNVIIHNLKMLSYEANLRFQWKNFVISDQFLLSCHNVNEITEKGLQ